VRINESIVVHAAADRVWEFIREPDNYLRFMSGITRWEVEGDTRAGLGARYRMLLRIGSAEIGGLIEIIEEVPARDLAWTSVTGLDQRGRWRLRERHPGITTTELRFSYGVAGSGIPGWISEMVAAPMVRRRLRASLDELKRQVEQQRRRAEAAERQSVAGGSGG
jgi:uncharacterized membrane protein